MNDQDLERIVRKAVMHATREYDDLKQKVKRMRSCMRETIADGQMMQEMVDELAKAEKELEDWGR